MQLPTTCQKEILCFDFATSIFDSRFHIKHQNKTVELLCDPSCNAVYGLGPLFVQLLAAPPNVFSVENIWFKHLRWFISN